MELFLWLLLLLLVLVGLVVHGERKLEHQCPFCLGTGRIEPHECHVCDGKGTL